MTQEETNLVLKDICSRLPYGVTVRVYDYVEEDSFIYHLNIENFSTFVSDFFIEDIKPFLYPMSSMTDEQAEELFNLFGLECPSTEEDYIKINEVTGITFFLNKGFDVETHLDKLTEWLDKNHFDYRGLIPWGLAINAIDLDIYAEN